MTTKASTQQRQRLTHSSPDPDAPLYRSLARHLLRGQASATVASGEFDEDKHPRDDHGRFESTGGSEKESSPAAGGKALPPMSPSNLDELQRDNDFAREVLGTSGKSGNEIDAYLAGPAKAEVTAALADRLENVSVKDLAACLGQLDYGFGAVIAENMGDHDHAIVRMGGSNGSYSVQDLSPTAVDVMQRMTDAYGADNVARLDTPQGEAMAREAVCSALVQQWAVSSNDSNAASLFMQECAKQEFGLAGVKEWGGDDKNVVRMLGDKDTVAAGRAFLRAQYDNTQEYLRGAGVDKLTLARGAVWASDGYAPHWVPDSGSIVTETAMRPMSSWTADADIAEKFATSYSEGVGAMQYASFPREAILACPRTGVGCLSESEFVVLHTGGESRVERAAPLD